MGNYLLTLKSLLLTTKEVVLINQYVIDLHECVKYQLVNQ